MMKNKNWFKGKACAGTLTLGIEHFFIPENTGAQWEKKTHDIVRMAENGDAILETLK
ncbi:GDYXXLXY domain-containing protein [Domibacillus antri]|uniref:GDYXXLXY domain-containing protein n=1 Tax=Domibacillus antri TaxID=1714264 RepID=UPI000A8C2C24|nr:GDYXXLXY domain-containing protein [Domibacillus antri]